MEKIQKMNQQLILSSGIFSDIEAWESSNGQDGLANKLARDKGRDVWEIEMTGGPISENESSLDYTYQNLVEDYWPALLGAVQYYTGKITMDYVGHSNGCRAALSSLKNYQTTGKSNVGIVQNLQTGNNVNVSLQGNSGAHVVNTFVGVACPGEVNEDKFLCSLLRATSTTSGQTVGQIVMGDINENHLEMRDYIDAIIINLFTRSQHYSALLTMNNIFTPESSKISKNLMSFYNNLSYYNNSDFDLSGLNVSKARLYYGDIPFADNHDGVVPVEDMNVILDQKNGQNWTAWSEEEGVLWNHVSIKNRNQLRILILEELK